MRSTVRNLSVGTKLFGGFGIVGLLLVAVAGAGFWAMTSLSSANHQITGLVQPKIAAASALSLAATTVDAEESTLVVDRGASLSTYEEARSGLSKAITSLKLVSSDPQDNALAARIGQTSVKLDTVNKGLVSAIRFQELRSRDDDRAGAVRHIDRRDQEGRVAYAAQANQEQVVAAGSFSSTKSTAQLIMIVLSVVAVLLAAVIAFLIARGIKGGIALVLDRLQSLRDHDAADLRAGLAAMAGGDLTVPIVPVTALIENPSRDEIGQAGAAANEIRNATVASVEAYNQMRAELSTLIGDVSGVSSTITAASQEIASTSEETGRAVSEIAQAIGEVAEGAERQARMVEHANTTSNETSNAAEQAREVATQGAESASQASTRWLR